MPFPKPDNDNVLNDKAIDLLDARTPQLVSAQPAATTGGRVAKSAYQKPELHVYGAVHTITAGLAGSGTDASGMYMDMTMSDCNTKQHIVRVGTHPAGFGLYLFDYKPGHRQQVSTCRQVRNAGFRHFGVMAQEVQAILPAAVSVSATGYLQVDYGRLGIVLQQQGASRAA